MKWLYELVWDAILSESAKDLDVPEVRVTGKLMVNVPSSEKKEGHCV